MKRCTLYSPTSTPSPSPCYPDSPIVEPSNVDAAVEHPVLDSLTPLTVTVYETEDHTLMESDLKTDADEEEFLSGFPEIKRLRELIIEIQKEFMMLQRRCHLCCHGAT